jgi:hypothetical protein
MEQQKDAVRHVSKTEEVQARLEKCAHCNNTGTCNKGKDGSSCEVCVRKNLKWTFVCSVCEGFGKMEPFTERLHNRIVPVLALFVVYVALIIICWAACTENKHFSELLAFSSTLIGSITGYYFGGKNK